MHLKATVRDLNDQELIGTMVWFNQERIRRLRALESVNPVTAADIDELREVAQRALTADVRRLQRETRAVIRDMPEDRQEWLAAMVQRARLQRVHRTVIRRDLGSAA